MCVNKHFDDTNGFQRYTYVPGCYSWTVGFSFRISQPRFGFHWPYPRVRFALKITFDFDVEYNNKVGTRGYLRGIRHRFERPLTGDRRRHRRLFLLGYLFPISHVFPAQNFCIYPHNTLLSLYKQRSFLSHLSHTEFVFTYI